MIGILAGVVLSIAWALYMIFAMPIGGTIKKGFSVARQSLPVVGIMFLFGFVWSLLNLYFAPTIQSQAQNPDVKISILIVIATLVFVFISVFLQAGSLGYVRDKIKQGKAELSAFKAAGVKYYLRLLAVGAVIVLVVAVFFIVAALSVALLKKPGLIIAVPAAIVAVYCVLSMFFAPYIVVLGEKKPMESIKNSMSLVGKDINFFLGTVLTVGSVFLLIAYLFPAFRNSKLGQKNFVKIIIMLGILVVMGFALGLVTGAVLGLLNAIAPGAASQAAYAILSSILNAFLGIFVTASFMGFYLEISNIKGV